MSSVRVYLVGRDILWVCSYRRHVIEQRRRTVLLTNNSHGRTPREVVGETLGRQRQQARAGDDKFEGLGDARPSRLVDQV